MRKTHKYKLQSQSNTLKIGNMLDDIWHIHVHILLLARRYYRMFGKNLSAHRINAHIAKLKKRTKLHWKDLPSQVVQDVVLRYGKAQDAFFQNIKDRKAGLTRRKVGRPKIKPQRKYNSMTFTQAGYTLDGNRIKINCTGTWFSFHKHRNKELSLDDRQWTCPECGSHHDRDINAAINIKRAGLAA
ncbi:MAG: zinc ribbon domain-containing protein [Candidatus Poribacteria bacterium]|nr:zinc ribbon domain-containing protein [Candidatus Poribacteria bacterium]